MICLNIFLSFFTSSNNTIQPYMPFIKSFLHHFKSFQYKMKLIITSFNYYFPLYSSFPLVKCKFLYLQDNTKTYGVRSSYFNPKHQLPTFISLFNPMLQSVIFAEQKLGKCLCQKHISFVL